MLNALNAPKVFHFNEKILLCKIHNTIIQYICPSGSSWKQRVCATQLQTIYRTSLTSRRRISKCCY